MKQLLITLLILCSLCGCSDNSSGKASLSIAQSDMNFTLRYDETKKTIKINSNSEWTITGGSSWCTSSHAIGYGDNYVNILVEENDTDEPRTTTFTVSINSVESRIITVTQNNYEIVLYDEYIAPDMTGMRDMKSIDFLKLMNIGWNLGNSLEAIIVNDDGTFSGDETVWGNPIVTKELITAIKNAGFNMIRIPASWSHQLEDQETYKIKESWLNRVEEVVTYALDNDMFVMLNIHWDGGWLDHPTEEYKDALNQKQEALWKQIALHFRNYDDRLMFAGSNEVTNDGDFSGEPTDENYTVQNSFNQTFVSAVRGTGGRNAYRHLVIQAYNTNTDYAIKGLKLPIDNVNNKMTVEIHYYTPYDFTIRDEGWDALWGIPYIGGDGSGYGQEKDADRVFSEMKSNFIDKGIPVMMGEFAGTFRTSLTVEEYTKHVESLQYYLTYISKSAKENGLLPVYWDNGVIDSPGSGLFDRSTGAQKHPDVISGIVNAVK